MTKNELFSLNEKEFENEFEKLQKEFDRKPLEINKTCISCILCKSCIACMDCYACIGLENRKYMILNVQLTKEEYIEMIYKLYTY